MISIAIVGVGLLLWLSLYWLTDTLKETNRLIEKQNQLHGRRNETLKKKFD